MKSTSLVPCITFTSLLFLACAPADGDDESTGADTGPDTSGGSETGPATMSTTSATGSSDATGSESSSSSASSEDESSGSESTTSTGPLVWTPTAGPCGGSGTNAFWFDDRMHGYIGCGENAAGEGLFISEDGAVTWDDQLHFGEVRIMDIRRGPDGVLYGAGVHQLDGYAAWTFDESGTIDATEIYHRSDNAFLGVAQAENIAITSDGQILIDSLTGSTSAYRPDASSEFVELVSLSEDVLSDPDALSYQVFRIAVHEDRFYAVGNLINEPARVYLPSQLPDATYHFHTVILQPDTRDGYFRDIAIWDDSHIFVAGHDEGEEFPLMYLLDGGDATDPAAWEKIELADSGYEYQGGVNDMHVVGDTVVAVGEKVPTAQGGFVILSEDRGRTWTDITPEGANRLTRVWMFDDGEMVVAGGGGEMWIYTAE